ncbi:MAG: metabolite traffic protein EboE [Phycisphaerales bacterium]|nr:metabolite traffic protein EboE [Phycisphaerales bacterium]
MTERPAPRKIGYCTNVHSGGTLEEMLANLQKHVPGIRAHLGDKDPLPIGLWISRHSLDDLLTSGVQSLKERLDQLQVDVFTINGFPYGNFHGQRVKHHVYEPNWSNSSRLVYTMQLARVLEGLLPRGSSAGISTLPIGWSDIAPDLVESAASNLKAAASTLAALESQTGICLHLDIEPEPGCLLQRSGDVASFFENHLLCASNEKVIRRHLRVCHDVCHAAVMFESQEDAIKTYDTAGIAIGKVQVSSALQADGGHQKQMMELAEYVEPRWLHQTCIRQDEDITFIEDLPIAIKGNSPKEGECWRVHFHVPVHQTTMGSLSTTQTDLIEAINLLADRPEITAWEVETYAWSAIPSSQDQPDLVTGISEEIAWTRQALDAAS